MSRIDKIAKSKTNRPSRFWFDKICEDAKKELLAIRANYHLGQPHISATELSEIVKKHFPKIGVKAREVCEWLKRKE